MEERMPSQHIASTTQGKGGREVRQSPSPALDVDEHGDITSLASELASAYKQMVAFYHHQLELALPDADRRARGLDSTPEEAAADLARIRDRPPDQVPWFDLNRLVDRDPDAFAEVWSQIKRQARQELASGQRTAKALTWDGSPWDRARFLALRDSFREPIPPQSGIEAALVDSAAEAFADYLECSEYLHMQLGTEVTGERDRLARDGSWEPQRLSFAEAIERSSKLVERAHQRFLRTLKMLHEWRRSAPTLYVGSAAQINVGQQQVNVAQFTRTRRRPEDLPKSTAAIRRRRVRPRLEPAVSQEG
jgi:hypothetical protein